MDAADALALWENEGHIDSQLATRLRASLAAHGEPEKANKIIWVFASIGALLIGGGLLLFIASQWDQSSPARRLVVLFGIYLVVVGAAALADRQQLGITARGLWFLSSITVGVNIFLAGQIFNLPLTYWQGTLLWLVATLAMGWASPASAQGWLAVPLGILTLGWITTPESQFFEQQEFLVASGGIRPLFPLVGFGLVAIAMLVKGTDFDWLRRAATFFGGLLVAVPVVVSTFHAEAYDAIFEIDAGLFHGVVGVGAIALVAVAAHRDDRPLLVVAFAAVAGLVVALLLGHQLGLDEAFRSSALLFGLYAAIILAMSVGAIVAGEHYEIRSLANAGLASVGVLVLGLYVGRIAGALPTALAVIGGGLLLVGGAIVMERKRRDINASPISPAVGAVT